MPCDCLSQSDFSALLLQQKGCPVKIPGECTYYSDVTQPSGVASGDSFNTVVKKLTTYVITSIAAIPPPPPPDPDPGGTGSLEEGNVDS